MKKFMLIGLIIALVLILVGGAGVVYAQVRGGDITPRVIVQTNPNLNRDKIVPFGYGPGGMMGGNGYYFGPGSDGYGYGPGGMMGGYGYDHDDMMGGRGWSSNRGEGFMHDYMISAFANTVGLTVDEVNTRLSNGESLNEIAIAQGTAQADLPALASKVWKAALDQAVADGVITQAQADTMLEHMDEYPGRGFGPGFGFDCPMWDNDELP